MKLILQLLQSYEDAVLLHKVLYDAVILVDYSFYSGRWVQSSATQLKQLAVAWVLAADRALQFARYFTQYSYIILPHTVLANSCLCTMYENEYVTFDEAGVQQINLGRFLTSMLLMNVHWWLS